MNEDFSHVPNQYQHTIPKFFLKGFTRRENKNSPGIIEFSKAKATKPQFKGVKRVAGYRNINDVFDSNKTYFSSENFYGNLENKWADAFLENRILDSSGMLNILISEFIVYQDTRLINKKIDLHEIVKLRGFLNTGFIPDKKIINIIALNHMKDTIHIPISNWLSNTRSIVLHRDEFNASNGFILGDQVISWYENDDLQESFSSYSTHCLVPISHEKILFIQKPGGFILVNNKPILKLYEQPKLDKEIIDRSAIMNAKDYFYSHPDDKKYGEELYRSNKKFNFYNFISLISTTSSSYNSDIVDFTPNIVKYLYKDTFLFIRNNFLDLRIIYGEDKANKSIEMLYPALIRKYKTIDSIFSLLDQEFGYQTTFTFNKFTGDVAEPPVM